MASTGRGGAEPKPGDDEAVVHFTTSLPEEYQVPDDPMVLPSSLARYGLSEVVNHLLLFDPPVPFDFLVDGVFLRGSIKEYLEASKLTAESAITLEYVLALGRPEEKEVEQVPDWISGVVALGGSWFAAVSYDGTARLYEGDRAHLKARLAEGPLTDVSAFRAGPADGGGSRLCVAAKDGTLRCVSLAHGAGAKAAAGPTAALRKPGPGKALQASAFREDGTLLAGAGWDGEIAVWNADVFTAPAEGGPKRKASAVEGASAPKFTLAGHSQCVTCVDFGAKARFPFALFSGSWDCSVRAWDIAAASCVCHWPSGRAVTSLTTSVGEPPLLCTAHEDGHVTLWDVRATPHAAAPGALQLDASAALALRSAQTSHQRLAAQVEWCPENAQRIASVGHDGRLCILDPRSPAMPLQAITIGKPGPSPTKVLCVAWLGGRELVTGGSDGVVRLHSLGPAEASG